ncbi:MAG: hypothetical protein WC248_03925 [Candidatus Methanomethylophilaceae archaeon]
MAILLSLLITPITHRVTEYQLPETETSQQVFLGGFDSPTLPQKSLGSLTGSVLDSYSQEWYQGVRMSELLDCLWLNESSRGARMYGDYWNGKPLAYGHYQIWLHIHPEVSYDCAMDLECSAAYTADEIRAGRLWQWTRYDYCLTSGK